MEHLARSVLFVTTSFPRFVGDFAGSFVHRFARYLVRDGMQVTVLAPGAPGYPAAETLDGIQVRRFAYFFPRRRQMLAYQGGGVLANVRRSWLGKAQLLPLFSAMVLAILRHQNRCDLIHCHWLPTAIAALLARPFSRVRPPIVFTNWGSDTRLLPLWLVRWTVSRVEGCISTAVETDAHLRAAGRTDFRRIPAPVNEEQFNRNAVRADLRRELGIAPMIPVFAFVGRLDSFKDPLTFLRACALLRQRGVAFAAVVMGDGPLMPDCRRMVAAFDLQAHVHLTGMRPDPERLYKIAVAAVHISPVENTWANAIAEAMFMEVPVVLSDAGYTTQLFTHRQDCLIVPPQNPPRLADALQTLLEDESLRRKLAAGAKRLLQKHNKDTRSIVRATRAYYDEILSRARKEKTHARPDA